MMEVQFLLFADHYINPQSRLVRVLLQGSDRLYLNTAEGIMRASSSPAQDSLSFFFDDDEEGAFEDRSSTQFSVAANKQWIVVPIPYKYTSSNWPIRVSQLVFNWSSSNG